MIISFWGQHGFENIVKDSILEMARPEQLIFLFSKLAELTFFNTEKNLSELKTKTKFKDKSIPLLVVA